MAAPKDAAPVVYAMRALSRSQPWSWSLLVGVVTAIACASCQRTVSYAEARTVVDRRCVECHADRPASRAFPIAPKGVKLDTALRMKRWAPRIRASVVERSMPLANLSGMTDEERRILGRWVEAGANVPE